MGIGFSLVAHDIILVGNNERWQKSPELLERCPQRRDATAAARHMARNRSGVILAITASAVRGYSNVGGFGVACAAIEGFCRQLAAEMGPQGIRVVCLRSAGSSDAPGVDEVFHRHAENAGISREAFEAGIAERTLLLDFLMGACSVLPPIPPIAFFLCKNRE